MVSRLPTLSLVLVLVLAGCSALPAPTANQSTPIAETTPEHTTGTGAPAPATETPIDPTTDAGTTEPTETPTIEAGQAENDPWPGSPTVVAINATATDRPMEAVVASALTFWERNDQRYGNYTTTFEVRPNASNPDIVVQFVTDIEQCGLHDDTSFVGCAPLLGGDVTIDPPTVVRIETGLTDESTERVIEHEFGHLYGLRHGDPPESLMSDYTTDLNRLPEPNVSERTLTWGQATVRVFVDRAALPGSNAEIDRQIDAALRYYDDPDHESIPPALSIRRVDDRSEADVIVTGRSLDRASNSTTVGADTDADPALEYFTNQTIVVDSGLDPEKLGWHVGFWLGDSLLAPATPAALPPPFDEPRTDPRREWWPAQ